MRRKKLETIMTIIGWIIIAFALFAFIRLIIVSGVFG
jgi:hypothetical protein